VSEEGLDAEPGIGQLIGSFREEWYQVCVGSRSIDGAFFVVVLPFLVVDQQSIGLALEILEDFVAGLIDALAGD
jgi:hypothetical protein